MICVRCCLLTEWRAKPIEHQSLAQRGSKSVRVVVTLDTVLLEVVTVVTSAAFAFTLGKGAVVSVVEVLSEAFARCFT